MKTLPYRKETVCGQGWGVYYSGQMQLHVHKSQSRFCRSESLRAQNGNSPSFSGKEGEGREWGRAEVETDKDEKLSGTRQRRVAFYATQKSWGSFLQMMG